MASQIDFKEEFEKEFGQLTLRQLWLLVLFAKNARLRCRSNIAFNNMANRAFPYATFKQVEKIKPAGNGYPEKRYPGLSIVIKGQEVIEETPFGEEDEN